jgi:tripartite-type tricarboxylate transporter receptor subunit TctC
VGPKNLNADQIAYWNDIFSKVVATDEWKTFARNSFLELDYHDSAGLATMLKTDSDATKAIFGRMGLLKTQ